ncbi:Uu.00g097150.m01.CDS01 [Anthostomella pinea]|uniref:Uu.00g097150.m01.CDS01 n=1 Tax=Anthostomella pinea TaxID=933095 RepID=A0AAI8YEX4_9PEZI|nr:Uu.00g097150.m01.CDS01 [Anthostomella pinea]
MQPEYQISNFQFNKTTISSGEGALARFQLDDVVNGASMSCATPYLQDPDSLMWNDCEPAEDAVNAKTSFQYDSAANQVNISQAWVCEQGNQTFPHPYFSDVSISLPDLDCIEGTATVCTAPEETGSEGRIGLISSTLGGDIGRLNGLHGLVIDALLSVRIVTASGEAVVASTTENSDLFWGIRGAGFDFGIIVSATYQVYDLSKGGEVMNADFLFSINETAAVLDYFKSMETAIPAELSLIFHVGYKDSLGGAYAVVNAVYFGPLDDGTPLVGPLVDAGPIQYNISMVAYRDLLSSTFFGAVPTSAPCSKDTLKNVYGLGLKNYDFALFQSFLSNLTELYATYPDSATPCFILKPSQCRLLALCQTTARRIRTVTSTDTYRSLDDMVNEFAVNARARFAATSGFGDIKTYVSYGHGDETPAQLYGDEQLAQLRELKSTWDPSKLFNFNEPLDK